jgi:hypothetical protein
MMNHHAPLRRVWAGVAAFSLTLGLGIIAAPVPPLAQSAAASAVSPPEPCPPGAERQLGDMVNRFRLGHGQRPLAMSAELMRKAQAWSDHLAAIQRLTHSTLSQGISPGWSYVGENVAYASSGLAAAQNGLEHSPPHLRNLLGDFTEMGLGVTTDARGFTWVAQVFVRRSTPTTSYGGPAGASAFMPVTPATVFRPAHLVPAGSVSTVRVTGVGGVPRGATAVATVLEAFNAGGAGWFQLLGPGDVRGTVSSLTLDQGRGSVTSITQVASDGTIQVTGSVAANVRVSVVGYFTRASSLVRAGRFSAISTARVLDTRPTSRVSWSGGRPGAGSVIMVPVLGRGGLPSTPVRAVVVNVVALGADGPGAVQVGMPGMTRGAWNSMLLTRPQHTLAGMVIAPVDAAGRIAIRTSVGSHLVIDLRGWFSGTSEAPSTRGLFVPIAATRFFDSRQSGGAVAGVRQVLVAGRAAMPACPSAVLGNITLLPSTTATAQIGPWGGFVPSAWSNVTTTVSRLPVKNEFIVHTGRASAIGVYSRDPAHVVVDLSGWFV